MFENYLRCAKDFLSQFNIISLKETFVKENSKTPSQGENIFEFLEAVVKSAIETKLAQGCKL